MELPQTLNWEHLPSEQTVAHAADAGFAIEMTSIGRM